MDSSPLTRRSSLFVDKKDVGVSAFYSQAVSIPLPAPSLKKGASNKIMSVMSPQQSERRPSTTGVVKTGMNMTEKILARASEKTQLSLGENVWVNVDVLMTHDVCGPGSIGIFKREFGENAKDDLEREGVANNDESDVEGNIQHMEDEEYEDNYF